MKRLLLLALLSGSWDSAFAKDSDWKLCKGDVVLYNENVKLVVTSYEHRNGEGRAADLTLIYGGNVLHGSLNTSENNNGVVKLKGYNSTFKGNVAIDFPSSTLALKGSLNLNNSRSDLDATLECETL